MHEHEWLRQVLEKGSVDIETSGGYTYEQVMWSRNTSKDPKYWYKITGKNKFLFRSKVAESWEFRLPWYPNPIRNMDQVYLYFKDSSVFIEPQKEFRENEAYTQAKRGTPLYEAFWDAQEDYCYLGKEVDGVRMSGRHYFMLNFGRMRAQPVKEDGTLGAGKIYTFPSFVDFQYYLANEIEWWYLDTLYSSRKKYMEWFPLATIEDYDDMVKQVGAVPKARRKGLTFFNADSINAYNFIFVENSYNIIGAYQESFYDVLLNQGVKPTIDWCGEHTPWQRRRSVVNRKDNFRASYKGKNEYGIEVEKGYKSEINCISFHTTAFAAVGKSADSVSIEEAGKFNNLLSVWGISIEPLIKDGNIPIGAGVIFGCVCAGTKVWTHDGRYINIEDLQQSDGILGYAEGSYTKEPIIYMQEPKKKKCYRIEGTNGFSIECSHDHPLLWSRRGWKKEVKESGKRKQHQKVTFQRAEDIIEGDYIMLAPNVPVFGKKKLENARLIGLMIGDGNYSERSTPTLSVAEDELFEFMVSQGHIGTVTKQQSTKAGGMYRQVTVPGLRDQLCMLDMYGQTKQAKRLPYGWEQYDRKSLSELLGGYYDADGCVCYNSKKKHTTIKLTSVVRPLLEQVQAALVKFNVFSYIKEGKFGEGGYNPGGVVYDLVIDRNRDVLNFRDSITFICKHKQDRLDSVTEKSRHFGYHKKAFFEVNENNNKGKEYYADHPWFEGIRHVQVTKVVEIGTKEVYNLCANKTHAYLANSSVSGNTSGEMDGAGGSQAMHEISYKPEAMGLVAYNNIYEEHTLGDKSSLFIDSLWFYPEKLDKSTILRYFDDAETKAYLSGFEGKYALGVDKMGNSHRIVAYVSLMETRKQKKKAGSKVYNNYITQYPMYLSEAFLITDNSPFDKALIREAKAELMVKDQALDIGYFAESSNGDITWRYDRSYHPVLKYPHEEDTESGCWIIFQHPEKEIKGSNTIRYIAGIDPIDKGYEEADSDNKHSLGSTYIMDTFTGNIVAAYTGRTAFARYYFREVVRGLKYFGAKVMYESNLAGFYQYCHNHKAMGLLADEPSILKNKAGYKMGKLGTKGFHATQAVNHMLLDLLAAWLDEEVKVGQDEETGKDICVSRYFTIRDMGLLDELEKYSPNGNFDRISALKALMLYYHQTANAREYFREIGQKQDDGPLRKAFKKKFMNDIH